MGAASGSGGLQLGMEGFSSTCDLPEGLGIFLNFPWAKLYTVTGMDMAVDFHMGIWVDVIDVGAVGVGTVGVKFTGTVGVGVVGMGWAITITL